MSEYRRYYIKGGTWFFTVNLRNRRSQLLTTQYQMLRNSEGISLKMYQVQDGYSQYKEIDLAARTAAASPLELVLVLFSGLMDELERAKSHIEGRRFEKKAQSINKCIDILNALTSSLEFETGGELVVNLSRLYDHCVYRLYEASGELSAEKIDEVMLILSNLREGWEGLSGKLG